MTTASLPAIPPYIERFEQLAYGLFLHYGVYSLIGEGEWAISQKKIPHPEYRRLAERFTAERFSGRDIAKLTIDAGMHYAVLTARHHDGFSLYDTRGLSTFDAPHSAARRDLIAEFVEGCRAEGIIPFLYHTTFDWMFDTPTCDAAAFNRYLDYLFESIEVLCTNYGEIGGFWFDGNWSRTDLDWREDELYSRIRRLQPEAMIINNSGLHALGARTHPQLDAVTFERGAPKRTPLEANERYVAAEMCQTTCQHWGYAANDFQHRSPASIIRDLCTCRGANANLLLNVGPMPDGSIAALDAAVLRRVGEWVKRHEHLLRFGRATDVRCSGSGDDFVLRVDDRLYLFAFGLPCRGDANVIKGQTADLNRMLQGLDQPVRTARWLDRDQILNVTPIADDAVTIELTGYPYGTDLVVRVAELLP